MGPVLEADRLYRFFHAGDSETLALQGISFTVAAGEVVAVVGPSGSGKSTLLSCLAGLDVPDGGMVRIDGVPTSRRSEAERAAIRARLIGVVLQQRNLLDRLTVAENLSVAQRLAGRADSAVARGVLDRLGLAHRAGARPGQLSGGEAVRAAVAVALVNEPAVVLADEPTGELDETAAGVVVELLRDAALRGAAVVVVTHAEAVASAADRRLVMYDGRLVA
jgi:putative ABC transport system ATP-binding protein